MKQRKDALHVRTEIAIAETKAKVYESEETSIRSMEDPTDRQADKNAPRPANFYADFQADDIPTRPADYCADFQADEIPTRPADYCADFQADEIQTRPADFQADEIPIRPADLRADDEQDTVSELLREGQLQQQKLLEIMQLPKVELMTLDGNPLKYWIHEGLRIQRKQRDD